MNATEERQIKSALDRLVEQTPELGPTPNDMFVRQNGRAHSWAPLTAVAAATVAVVGLGFIVASRDTGANTSTVPASQPGQTEPAPTTAHAASTTASDTESTVPLRNLNWESAVAEVLNVVNWELVATEYSPNDGEPFGGSVVALAGAGRVVFDVQTYADGEFSDDPDWQMGVAGSNTPGTQLAEGTLFVTDEASTSVRSAVVVSPFAIVTVHAESVPLDELPDIDTFSSAAVQLAARLPNVLEAAGS